MIDRKKLIRAAFLVLLAAVSAVAAWIVLRYTLFNEYRQYLSSYTYEVGSGAFEPLSSSVEAPEETAGMDVAAENGSFVLYADTDTGSVALYDRRSGAVTWSNPPDAAQDPVANATNKNYLRSQLILDYYNTERLDSTFDSWSYCVERDQLAAETIENGIRFLYTLGDMTPETGIVPLYIRTSTLEEITSKLDEKDAKFVTKKYTSSSMGDEFLELLESARTGASQLRKLNKYLEEAGFTLEDYGEEMAAAGVEDALPVHFVIPLEYRLLNDGLQVSVPVSGIEEYGGGAVHRIRLLSFFGAGGTEEEGSMLVPNGSGSLIYFNNGKGKLSSGNDYSEFIYGNDPLAATLTVRENSRDAKMALFGIFREDNAILATIEDGASLANVTANVSSDVNSYNSVGAIFTLRGDEKLSMTGTTGSEANLPIIESSMYDVNITVRYTFLTGEDASLSGAAAYYRTRLINEGVLEPDTGDSPTPFYYDIIGGVERTAYMLGVQYRSLYPMTTFEQAEQIAHSLDEAGVRGQVMNFRGWTSGGYYGDVLGRVRVLRKLGGTSGLEALSQTMEDLGGRFYADAAFQKVSLVSSHYSRSNETARYYATGYYAEFGLVNPTSLRATSGLGYEENRYDLISPKFLVRYTGRAAQAFSKLDIEGISLRDLGNELHSDKKRTNVIDREAALDVVRSQLQVLSDTGKALMVTDSNDYAFAYAEDILDAPLTGNAYYVIDEQVPFYEMLIHGCIDYSGEVINLSDTTDETEIALGLIEAGASPHFTFTYEDASEMKETGLNRYYSVTFTSWAECAARIYATVSSALDQVRGQFMTGYEKTEDGVAVVTYSEGTKILVNRTDEAHEAGGVTVAAHSFEVL